MHSGCSRDDEDSDRKKKTGAAKPANKTDGSFMILPNPSNGNFAVNFTNLTEQKQVIITDLNGKMIQHIALAADVNHFEITNIATGLYLVNVVSGSFNTTQKIIVTK